MVKTVRLGSSGLEISGVVLGMMSYGHADKGLAWTLDLDAARPIVQKAYDAGITTFDTANIYTGGSSEEFTGTLVKELGPRESMQIFTKVFGPTSEFRNGHSLSRIGILRAIDESLTRLGTDYVDLYQIHRFDPATPIEETMEALHDVVKAGKARYIGASSMAAWQFAQMQHVASSHAWTEFVSMQDQYNLLQREEEREMHPYCLATRVGVIPWAPLASGYVTRPWGDAGSGRAARDEFGTYLNQDSNEAIVTAVQRVAASRGVPMAQVALAWVADRPVVSAPIIGATKSRHVHDAIAALDLELSDEEIEQLQSAYTPRTTTGY